MTIVPSLQADLLEREIFGPRRNARRKLINSDGELLCPCCGFNYLHHSRVVTYGRAAEDAAEIVKTTVVGDMTTVTLETGRTGNPSGRRGGFAVEFLCEGCHASATLTFGQDKGTRKSPGAISESWGRLSMRRR
jgi:hypothetical protein